MTGEKAGIAREKARSSQRCPQSSPLSRGQALWIPAFAGMTGEKSGMAGEKARSSRRRPQSSPLSRGQALWIPAFAGMTGEKAGMAHEKAGMARGSAAVRVRDGARRAEQGGNGAGEKAGMAREGAAVRVRDGARRAEQDGSGNARNPSRPRRRARWREGRRGLPTFRESACNSSGSSRRARPPKVHSRRDARAGLSVSTGRRLRACPYP